MLRIWLILASIVLIFFSHNLKAENITQPIATNELEPLNSQRVIRIALPDRASIQSASSEHFQLLVNFLKEYWQIWAIDQQMTIEFFYMSTLAALEKLEKKQIDIISISTYEPSLDKVLFSLPYAHYQQRIYLNNLKSNNTKMSIGIADESKEALEHLPTNIQRHYFDDEQQLLNHYQRFDAIYSTRPWRLDFALDVQGLDEKFYIDNKEEMLLPVHFLVHQSDRNLLHIINNSIREVSHTQAQLWREKYFNTLSAKFTLALGDYITDLSEEEKNYIIDHNIVRYPITTNGFPPFVITNESFNNLTDRGFSIDLLKIASKKLGLQFKPSRKESYQEMRESLHSGQTDLYAIVETFESHKETLQFTSNIARVSYNAVFNPKTTPFLSLEDTKSLNVALVDSLPFSSQFIKENPKTKIHLYDTIEKAIEGVANGKSDIYIGRSLITGYLIKQLKFTNLTTQYLNEINHQTGYAFASLKSNDPLISLLNKALSSIPDNQLEMLYNKYSHAAFAQTNVQAKVADAYRQASYVFFAILLVALIVFWVYYRQLQVRKLAQRKIEHALTIAEAARNEAEQSAQAKITFLARMSHEIRTPMNGVLGMAEALNFTKLNKEQADLLDTLEGSARHLLALLNDVLDFSKMDAGKLILESVPVNLHLLGQNIIRSFKHVEHDQPLKLSLNIDRQITHNYYTDPTRLNQVLNNLLSNAIKFTEQGAITLSIHRTEQALRHQDIFDTIRISVKDDGIGISEEQQKKLFSPFIQADSDITRKFGGTGLGLSICQEIVIAMGGQIQINSTSGHGSEFYFDITIKEADFESETEDRRKNNRTINAPQDDRFKDINLLIAEDNLVNVKVLSAQLARLGIEADIAYDGVEAYEKYLKKQYDIIISDCHMPNMDGFELAEKIVQSNNKPLWLIAVTADALSGASEKCLNAGFDDYMAKPCPQEEITNKLNHAYRELQKRKLLISDKPEESFSNFSLFSPANLLSKHNHNTETVIQVLQPFINTWQDQKQQLLKDLDNGNSDELSLHFIKLKRFVNQIEQQKIITQINEASIVVNQIDNKKLTKNILNICSQLDLLYVEAKEWLENTDLS